jgi:hypothetical protein
VLILEHYHDTAPGSFGPPLPALSRFRLAPAADIRAQLSAAANAHTEIELRGPVLNPTAAHAAALASAFADASLDLRVIRAEWLPGRRPTPALVPLLHRIDALEIEYPSTAPAARRWYRRRFSHHHYRELIEWLHRHRIEPVVVVRPGLPGESEATVLETLRRVYSLRPARVRVEPFTAEPGSFFAANRDSFRLTIEEAPPYLVLARRGANSFELRFMVAIAEKSVKDYNHWKAAAAAARGAKGAR